MTDDPNHSSPEPGPDPSRARDAETTPMPERAPEDSDPEAETSAEIVADEPTTPHTPPGVDPGPEEIHGYRLMGPIGRGGMGTVHLAQRLDDRFRKRVAIKIMRRGLDTDEMLERFHLERQVLGALNHPNIARLFDAGATADGRPYFVMEHVEGRPIDEFCDEHNLSLPERIRLFTKVCAAVHYAHQNLIVHRDLKPSNILVNAEGEPKLLDFGIAKLLNPDLLGLPALTRADQRIMTYEYASPEQVRGQQITTASDVYALGVILYELLTGHRPYQIERRLHAEAVRVICEAEPQRPSTAVSRAATRHTTHGEMHTITAAEIARRREVQITRLKKSLAGDLDNIILMALRKSAQRRYTTAQSLADDLTRHLEGQTVTACPPTFAYRAGKFIRRHRAAVVTGSALILFLVVGVAFFSWAWVRTERALEREQTALASARLAEQAEREQRERADTRYEQLRRMFTIEDEIYRQIERLPAATAARRILGEAMLDAIDALADAFQDDEQLRRDLAVQYRRVGRLAAAGENAVGRGVEALERSAFLFASIPGAEEGRIRTAIDLAAAYRQAGDRDSAFRVAMNGADLCDSISSAPDAFAALPILHAECLMQGALVRMFQARYGDAEPLLAEALVLAAGAAETDPDNPEALRALAYAHEHLGFLYDYTNRGQEELDAHRRCLELRRLVYGLDPDDDARRRLVMAHERVGRALMDLGRHDEAQGEFEIMQTLARDAAANDPFSGRAFSDLARSFENAADLARLRGEPGAGEPYARAFVAHAGEAVERDPLDLSKRRMLGLAHYKLGRTLADQNRHAEAIPGYNSALAVLTAASDTDPADAELRKDVMRAAYRLGISARRADEVEAARIGYERAIAEAATVAERDALNPGDRNLVTFAVNNLAAIAHDAGQGRRMVELAETAGAILGETPPLIARQHARGLALLGEFDRAVDVLRRAMRPFLDAESLASADQRMLDELRRLESEYLARLEEFADFDAPPP